VRTPLPILIAVVVAVALVSPSGAQTYVVVDTGQTRCFDTDSPIAAPTPGATYYGQDAQYAGVAMSYQDNNDGTVTDLNTGLMWQQTPDFDNKVTWDQAMARAATLSLGGHNDWRLPTIKELYSLMHFDGVTGFNESGSTPYIDTDYFDFAYGDIAGGDRFIDAQYFASTGYVGTTMGGNETVFGVNFADGRIKGYGIEERPDGTSFARYARYVRGNPDYGVNNFADTGSGTIVDLASGLMWMKGDSGAGMNWEDALAYAESLNAGGHDDWRLPDAKELQSIVDYTRAPDATDPAAVGPAIHPIFEITEDESWFWTSTTHSDGPNHWAAYICFGQGTGLQFNPQTRQWELYNAHGAGAQRSDPKDGDPDNWPTGHGPQGDEIRIFNYARAVRTVSFVAGDANFDGTCNVIDLASLATHYGHSDDVDWLDGDFTGDGRVDVFDLAALAANYGVTAGGVSTVPEPFAVAFIAAGAFAVMGRSRRRRRAGWLKYQLSNAEDCS